MADYNNENEVLPSSQPERKKVSIKVCYFEAYFSKSHKNKKFFLNLFFFFYSSFFILFLILFSRLVLLGTPKLVKLV